MVPQSSRSHRESRGRRSVSSRKHRLDGIASAVLSPAINPGELVTIEPTIELLRLEDLTTVTGGYVIRKVTAAQEELKAQVQTLATTVKDAATAAAGTPKQDPMQMMMMMMMMMRR
jgi:hypothetical protein